MSSAPSFSTRGHVLRFAALASWCAVVWYLSAQPDPGAAVGFYLFIPDKVAHILEFAAGGFLAHAAFRPFVPTRTIVAAMAFVALNGVVDEIHQSFVPDRVPSVADFVADVVGGLLGVGVHIVFERRFGGAGHVRDDVTVDSVDTVPVGKSGFIGDNEDTETQTRQN